MRINQKEVRRLLPSVHGTVALCAMLHTRDGVVGESHAVVQCYDSGGCEVPEVLVRPFTHFAHEPYDEEASLRTRFRKYRLGLSRYGACLHYYEEAP